MSEAEDYLRRLDRGLKGLPRSERGRIVNEIRSHLDERGAAAISGLGDADALARSFVDDYRAAKVMTLGEGGPLGGSLVATARLLAFGAAVLVSAVLYTIGVAAGFFAIGKFAAPRYVGCWSTKAMKHGEMSCYFNSTPTKIPAGASDPGQWIAPLCAVVAIVAFVLATVLLLTIARRFVIRPVFDAYRAARRRGSSIAGNLT